MRSCPLAASGFARVDAVALTYGSWSQLVEACEEFMVKVNSRPHRATRQIPAEMLAEEQARLHRLPEVGFTAAFGETRKVSWSSTISSGGVSYSVPHPLVDEQVWVRVDGDEIVAVHVSERGAVEVARHLRSTPGSPRIDDAHYPPRPAGALNRQPKPVNPEEAEFLAIGQGAHLWLVEAAATGASRIRVKMAEAVALAAFHGTQPVDWALGHAACYQRFGDVDLASILAAHPAGERRHPSERIRCSPPPKHGNTSVEEVADDCG